MNLTISDGFFFTTQCYCSSDLYHLFGKKVALSTVIVVDEYDVKNDDDGSPNIMIHKFIVHKNQPYQKFGKPVELVVPGVITDNISSDIDSSVPSNSSMATVAITTVTTVTASTSTAPTNSLVLHQPASSSLAMATAAITNTTAITAYTSTVPTNSSASHHSVLSTLPTEVASTPSPTVTAFTASTSTAPTNSSAATEGAIVPATTDTATIPSVCDRSILTKINALTTQSIAFSGECIDKSESSIQQDGRQKNVLNFLLKDDTGTIYVCVFEQLFQKFRHRIQVIHGIIDY